MTNNPTKRVGLESYGIEIVEVTPLVVPTTPFSEFYMQTKRDKMGHILPDALFSHCDSSQKE